MKTEEIVKTFHRAIDKVVAYPPGPKRWRAANDLWLSLNPNNIKTYHAVAKENREHRESLGRNKYALGEEKNLRHILNIPTGAYYAIQRSDPNVFKKKANAVRFFKEFKEYNSAEVY